MFILFYISYYLSLKTIIKLVVKKFLSKGPLKNVRSLKSNLDWTKFVGTRMNCSFQNEDISVHNPSHSLLFESMFYTRRTIVFCFVSIKGI